MYSRKLTAVVIFAIFAKMEIQQIQQTVKNPIMINLYAHDFCESSFSPIQRTSVVTRYTQYENPSPYFLCYSNISCAFNLPLLDRFG